MIEQRAISLISNSSQDDGGRRVPEAVIERDYCLSWFLFGLANSPLRDLLVFKGGTAMRRCHFQDYRFSEDLDFTMVDERPLEDVLGHLDDIFEWILEENGIEFGLGKKEDPYENNYTFYLTYIGPLPGKAKEVKVDISFRETILQPIQEPPSFRLTMNIRILTTTPLSRSIPWKKLSSKKYAHCIHPRGTSPVIYMTSTILPNKGV